jgi:serine protease Do
VIDIGTSSDLMPGESVVAVGNAFGYEHTATRGIISALHRNVQISDAQTYLDLIQTDASINPGNSGGPLLNIDGQMIGINVAVRSGAQGIGFAIPVDQAMEVAARLLNIRRLENTWHGVVAKNAPTTGQGLVVEEIEQDSPASRSGLKPGDRITSVGPHTVNRALDLERAFLGHRPGEELELTVQRRERSLALKVVLEVSPSHESPSQRQAWEVLGLKLAPIPPGEFDASLTRYRGGLTVTDVRPGSPADDKGIRRGDVLVGMHVWETVSLEDVQYIISQTQLQAGDPIKFYILRDNRPFYGFVSLAQHGR